jgi:pimeloyl-ACP methyl ester carboxylesterase
MQDSQIAVGGGRKLAYTDIGHPSDLCVFFFHGAPMNRLHLVGIKELFVAEGLRVVSPNRPGYGRSSPRLRMRSGSIASSWRRIRPAAPTPWRAPLCYPSACWQALWSLA